MLCCTCGGDQRFNAGACAPTDPSDATHGGMDQKDHSWSYAYRSQIRRHLFLRNRFTRAGDGSDFCHDLAAAAVAGYVLRWNPDAFGSGSCLPENINWHAATRIPVSPDAQPLWVQQFDKS